MNLVFVNRNYLLQRKGQQANFEALDCHNWHKPLNLNGQTFEYYYYRSPKFKCLKGLLLHITKKSQLIPLNNMKLIMD